MVSIVIHDDDQSHHAFINLLGPKEKVVLNSEKDLKRRRLMMTINIPCGLLKFENAKHKGLISRNLVSFMCMLFFKAMMKKKGGFEIAIDYILSKLAGKENAKG